MVSFQRYFVLISLLDFSFSAYFVEGFVSPSSRFTPAVVDRKTASKRTTELCMSSTTPPHHSRRDLLRQSSATAAATLLLQQGPPPANAAFESFTAPVTAQSAINKANESYQGVYYDPNHPTGYRILKAVKGSSTQATMTLCDGGVTTIGEPEPTTFRDIPVVIDDSDNNNKLVFDFGFKNGPKGITATLSPDKQSLTFPDGNTWTKNFYKYDGIYKITTSGGSSLSPDAYRIIRKNGAEIIIEMNDTGNPKDSYLVDGSVGTLFSIPTTSLTFYFGGKKKGDAAAAASEYSFFDALYDFQRGNEPGTSAVDDSGTVVGQLSLQEKNTVFPYGTITFPDKTVWTRI